MLAPSTTSTAANETVEPVALSMRSTTMVSPTSTLERVPRAKRILKRVNYLRVGLSVVYRRSRVLLIVKVEMFLFHSLPSHLSAWELRL